jgi:hypothetical protein
MIDVEKTELTEETKDTTQSMGLGSVIDENIPISYLPTLIQDSKKHHKNHKHDKHHKHKKDKHHKKHKHSHREHKGED